ncbi:hypothetical protein CVT26_007703 [Gymnopilus dilepis]|uniref:Uncharacterized protein n=1 Tax=Gymnopilus dilepis TaxID=231916 RepID=A0A409WIK0_9AGAR|nr:hypothetical protein CVT26_007703 [Gymnopilus dilepis]
MAAKVVFPPPPPTTNELTAQQRTQLVRTSRKIEQLLGTAPRFIDTSLTEPIHVTLSRGISQRRLTKTRRSSVDSTSSASSSESSPPPKFVQRSSSLSGNFSGMHKATSGSHRSSRSTSSIALESWVNDQTIPVLRLAVQSILETIPASPDPTQTTFTDTANKPLPNAPEAGSIFPAHKAVSSPRSSVILPPLTIPSPSSLRKQKMDRLRKKLGDDVPLELVFPKEHDVKHSENIPSHAPPANLVKECPPLPPPSPRPVAKRATRRIASSRDSISGIATIHRARRQTHTSSAGKQGTLTANRKPVPPALPNAEFKRVKQRLSFIIESPDEHGSSCSEEFGIPRATSQETDMSSWILKSHNAEIKFWSTRKGYEGWRSSSVSFLPNSSSSSLASSDDGSSVEPASPASTAATSPVSPGSEESSPTTEAKKRPLSYRKPPPPIPEDLF